MIGSSGGRMRDLNHFHGHFYHYAVVKVQGGSYTVEIVPLDTTELRSGTSGISSPWTT